MLPQLLKNIIHISYWRKQTLDGQKLIGTEQAAIFIRMYQGLPSKVSNDNRLMDLCKTVCTI